MFGRTASLRLTLLGAALAAAAPRAVAQVEVADLREDVKGLGQRVDELALRVEQLERENGQLRTKLAASEHSRDVVTPAELNGAVADLNSAIKTAVDNSRAEILQRVAVQMENLAKQTNAALDSLAKQGTGARTAPATSASPRAASAETYPKEGISYTVQKGDSLGGIARKTGAKAQDIIDANKLTDPSHIQAGQVLFIPGGK